MTLDQITTPFERRRVIEYRKDSNKVVRHWYEVQHVVGTLYKTRTTPDEWNTPEFKLCVFFDGGSDGILWQWMRQPERYTVDSMEKSAKRYCVDSIGAMLSDFRERMKTDRFIGNKEIEFIRQFDPAFADVCAKYREDYYARKKAKEAERRQTLEAEEEAEEAAEKVRRQAEMDAAKAKYLGWADTMSPMRFGKVDSILGTLVRCDGKVMSRREFVIQAVEGGWMPKQMDGVTSWHGSKWEPKQSKPRTEYCLVKENFSYKVSKTEFDFAVYIAEHKDGNRDGKVDKETIQPHLK